MKSLFAIIAFAALSLASCQKEEIFAPAESPIAMVQNPETHQLLINTSKETPAVTVAQVWILEDSPYSATITTNGFGQQTIQLASGPKSVSGVASSVLLLPAQVLTVFAQLGVAVPPNSTVWETSTGGFLVEIDQLGNVPTSVYWFNNWYCLRSIGHIQN